jgi:hypothetical protein
MSLAAATQAVISSELLRPSLYENIVMIKY